MSFIHVEPLDLMKTHGAQHPHPADPKNDFLAQPVMPIAAVEIVR